MPKVSRSILFCFSVSKESEFSWVCQILTINEHDLLNRTRSKVDPPSPSSPSSPSSHLDVVMDLSSNDPSSVFALFASQHLSVTQLRDEKRDSKTCKMIVTLECHVD